MRLSISNALSSAPLGPAMISAIVLAGGRGSRMGGVDKGLQSFRGQPLALHSLQRLHGTGSVGPVMLNANRNLAEYQTFGAPVWPDGLADYAGPLAGFLVGLAHCQTPYLLTLPCDTPLFPLDLVPRLCAALEAQEAQIAMAAAPERDEQGQTRLRKQPVFCLLHTDLLPGLRDFTQAGGRKIDAWAAQQRLVVVPFDLPGDDPLAFFNANTLDELQALEAQAGAAPAP
jgi:molybdopterin-guanine dinucleotide biosynthesis protein A